MSVVPLQCPLCAGLLQIDSSMAGQQVQCPMCAGVLQLPPLEHLELMAQQAAAQQSAPQQYAQQEYPQQAPAGDPLLQLPCPACQSAMTVPLSMAGQQVGCPFCNTPIALPPHEIFLQYLGLAPQPSAQPAPQAPQQSAAPQKSASQIAEEQAAARYEAAKAAVARAKEDREKKSRPTMVDMPATKPSEKPAPTTPRKPASEPVGDAAPKSRPTLREEKITLPKKSEEAKKTDEATTASKSKPAAPVNENRYPPGFQPKSTEKPAERTAEKPTEKSLEKPATPAAPVESQPTAKEIPDRQLEAPVAAAPSPTIQPEASEKPREKKPSRTVDHLLPPGAEVNEPSRAVSTEANSTTSPSAADLLPPGADLLPPMAAGGDASMLPPAANAGIDSLLPPGATAEFTSRSDAMAMLAAEAQASGRPKDAADNLLPPTAGDVVMSTTLEQVAIPDAPRMMLPPPENLAPGAVAVPTEDGGYVTVRETPKTIGKGDDEIELRRLTPEEKAKRRFRRNVIMFTVCMAILGIFSLVMMYW